MGMFDYVNCKFPLPYPEMQDARFQTKDTPEQYMVTYEITEDGRFAEVLTEPVKKTLEDGSKATIHTPTGKLKFLDWHGYIRFYEFRVNPGQDDIEERNRRKTWYEFAARFSNGFLDELAVLEGPEIKGPSKRTRTFLFEPGHRTEVKRFYIPSNVRKEAKLTCPECGREVSVFFDHLSYPISGELVREASHCHDCCCDIPYEARLNISVTVVDVQPNKDEIKSQDSED